MAWLEVIGSIVLIGALAQAIVATLLDVTTSWLPRERRLTLRPRLDAAPRWVLAAPQAAVLAVAVASID